jgi:acetyl esterase/lipase
VRPAQNPRSMTDVAPVSRVPWILGLVFALALLFVACQRLGRFPWPGAWLLAVGSAEWGHWLALAALLLGLLRPEFSTRLVCAAVVIVALGPAWTASRMDAGFSWTQLAFGPSPTGPNRELTLPNGKVADLYIPQRLPAPAVLVVHGGSWSRGTRKDLAGLNSYLRDKGYFVAALSYSFAPQHPYPAANRDLDTAYDYLVSHSGELGIDGTRIAWLGRSAGGHLALLQAYSRRPSRAVIAFYAPNDMVWSYEHPSNPYALDSPKSLREFLGGTPGQIPEIYLEASPLQQVRPGAPPTLLLHGLVDDLVFPEQSRRLQARLLELGVPSELHEYPWGHHGLDVNPNGPGGQLTSAVVEAFLRKHLLP